MSQEKNPRKSFIGLENLGEALKQKNITLPKENPSISKPPRNESQSFKHLGPKQRKEIPRVRDLNHMTTSLVSATTGISEKEVSQDIKKFNELVQQQNKTRRKIREWPGERKGDVYQQALRERTRAEIAFNNFGREIASLPAENIQLEKPAQEKRIDKVKEAPSLELNRVNQSKKMLHWDGKNMRSTQPGRDVPYEKYVRNYDSKKNHHVFDEKRIPNNATEKEFFGNNFDTKIDAIVEQGKKNTSGKIDRLNENAQLESARNDARRFFQNFRKTQREGALPSEISEAKDLWLSARDRVVELNSSSGGNNKANLSPQEKTNDVREKQSSLEPEEGNEESAPVVYFDNATEKDFQGNGGQLNLTDDTDEIVEHLFKKTQEIREAKNASEKSKQQNFVEELKRRLEQEINGLDDTNNVIEKATENNHSSEVQSILKSLDAMKKDSFATPSMIMREKRKMRDLIKEGKVDPLEAELLMQETKKTKLEGKLGLFAGRVAEKNRQFKKESWFYRNIISIPDYDKKWKVFAHRAAKTALIGAGAGLLGMTGVGMIAAGSAGAAYSLGRLGMSAGAGFVAGETHRNLTQKQLGEDKARYKTMYQSERLDKKQHRLSAEELQQLRTLRQNGIAEKKELNDVEQKNLASLEAKYEQYTNNMSRSLDNYNELLMRRRGKNEKNRMLWAGAAGLIVGMVSGYRIPRAEFFDNLEPSSGTGGAWGPEIPSEPLEKVVVSVPEFHEPTFEDISDMGKVRNGDGISQIIKRQLDADPELAAKFGITTGSSEEYKTLMERMGYKQGNSEVWLKGGDMHIGKDAYVPGINADGDPVIYEFKNGQSQPFEHQCFDSGFEGGATFDNDHIDPNEYLKNTAEPVRENNLGQYESYNRPPVGPVQYYDPRVENSYNYYIDQQPSSSVEPSYYEAPSEPIEHTNSGAAEPLRESPEQPRSYDPRGKSTTEIRRDLREMNRRGEITNREHRILKRELFRDGRTWVGKNKGWLGAIGLLGAADLIEDGKFNIFGIFDKKGVSIGNPGYHPDITPQIPGNINNGPQTPGNMSNIPKTPGNQN